MDQRGLDRVLGVAWAFTSTSLLMTVTRFGLEDWLIVPAMALGFVMLAATHSIALACLRFYQIIDKSLGRAEWPESWWYRRELIFRFIKLSMLAFYRRFLTKKPYTTILYGFMAFVIMGTIATTIPAIFHREPIEGAWILKLKGSNCNVYGQKLHVAGGVINLLTDVVLVALPIPVVVRLRTSPQKKGLVALFSLGCVVTFATAYRLAETIEMNLGIICANVPSLASLGRAMFKGHQQRTNNTDPYDGNKSHYELSGNGPRSSKKPISSNDVVVVVGRNTSEEQMVPKDSDVVRSTNVQINYEPA
ncbi:MAG: hypothetical protein M1815_005133 [Lichina confinis]|nr:MAG: hypothetical protein M1815_005133 [Lichina confinis]